MTWIVLQNFSFNSVLWEKMWFGIQRCQFFEDLAFSCRESLAALKTITRHRLWCSTRNLGKYAPIHFCPLVVCPAIFRSVCTSVPLCPNPAKSLPRFFFSFSFVVLNGGVGSLVWAGVPVPCSATARAPSSWPMPYPSKMQSNEQQILHAV